MHFRDGGDWWIGVIFLAYCYVFKIQGQTHRMQVKSSNANDICRKAVIHLPLCIGSQRLIDEDHGNNNACEKSTRTSYPPEPFWHGRDIHSSCVRV